MTQELSAERGGATVRFSDQASSMTGTPAPASGSVGRGWQPTTKAPTEIKTSDFVRAGSLEELKVKERLAVYGQQVAIGTESSNFLHRRSLVRT
jgi:hypothetical protein